MKPGFTLTLSLSIAAVAMHLASREAAAGEPAVSGAAIAPLTQLEAAFTEACKQELAASEVYDSYQMAYAAAREIAEPSDSVPARHCRR